MIENVRTGERVVTVVRSARPDDLRKLGIGWRFDWVKASASAEVYSLLRPNHLVVTLGLIGLQRVPGQYVEIDLLEVNPGDVGPTKTWEGIAGNLFAFAAELSIRIGGEGIVALIAKTELIGHYERKYGFRRIGRSARMIMEPASAVALIQRYKGGPSDV